MVLATEHAGLVEGERANSSEDYQIVDAGEAEPGNLTAGNKVTSGGDESAAQQTYEAAPQTPTRWKNEIQQLKQLVSKYKCEQMVQEITGNQLENDKEDLQIELSRVRMQLAKAKTESANRKKKYDALLEEVQMAPDKLSKKLVELKRRGDDLQCQLKTDLDAQKTFWQEINQQLHKENEHCLEEISNLNESLEAEKADRAQNRQEAKKIISELEEKLEEALQEKTEMQIQFDRLKVENAKLRQEKTQQVANYEDRLSKMQSIGQSPVPEEDTFSTDDMLRMMQEQLGVEDFEEQ